MSGSRQFRLSTVEFVHRGRSDEPCADAEAGARGFEQVALVLVTGKLSPSIANDFAIDGRAHVTDHVRSHEFHFLNALAEHTRESCGGQNFSPNANTNKEQTPHRAEQPRCANIL